MDTGSQISSCYDRPIDKRPTSKACSPRSKVIRSNVSSRVQVCIQLEPALYAMEITLASSVLTACMPALRTLLRRVPRVYIDHKYPCHQGFVGHEGLKSSKTPRVESPLQAFSTLHPGADIRQIFQCDRIALLNRCDHLLRKHVITIAAETFLSAKHLSKMSSSRLSAFRLKSASKTEGSVLNLSPMTLPKKSCLTRHRGAANPEIYADHFSRRFNCLFCSFHRDVQPKSPLAIDAKIRRTDLPTNAGLVVLVDLECQNLTSRDRGYRSSPFRKINRSGSSVVSHGDVTGLRARDLFAFDLEGSSRSERFCSANAGGANELRGEARLGSFGVVGFVVKLDSVDAFLFPADRTDAVVGIGVFRYRVSKDPLLFGGRTHSEFERQPYHESYSSTGVGSVNHFRQSNRLQTKHTMNDSTRKFA